ncbi:MAG: peptidylprolyl isomerase [Armatimonadota bacterium]|nr:peptidylprolyl isomerase [Armatimonadota bacterium]MDR7533793.1 peptidylprolyl isomerase [Armatimonadota bacterium]MDR7536678.1 peptidylprolyl isomerase [Armatimonadota bacterium]
MTVRRIVVAAAVVVAVGAAGASAWYLSTQARRGAAVAARVNGEAIYWSQVDAEVRRAAAQFGVDPSTPEFEKQREQITKIIIDQMVAQRLIMQEARKRHLTATDQDVEAQLVEIVKRFPGKTEFEQALQRNDLTLAGLRELLRIQLTQRRVAEAVVRVTVTDDEVRRQFDGNRRLYDRPAQIRVSHILVRIADKGQEAIAQAKVKVVQARLADGGKFEDLARQYSEDPGSAAQGGDLGYVSKGTLVREFEEAAWALKPGQISGPVRTQYGLHIIKVADVKPAQAADFARVREQIRQELLASKREKAFESWLADVRKGAAVEQFQRI